MLHQLEGVALERLRQEVGVHLIVQFPGFYILHARETTLLWQLRAAIPFMRVFVRCPVCVCVCVHVRVRMRVRVHVCVCVWWHNTLYAHG